MSGRLAGRGAIGPEGVRGNLQPFRGIAFAGLDDRFSYCMVLPLNDAIRLRVISQNPDMSNAEALLEPAECGDKHCAIVGHDFFNGTPSA